MITIILGKPGTGKSYHCTRYLADYIGTLARKENFERKVFTNLSVNIEAFQRYYDRRKIKVDVKDVLFKLDDAELKYDERYLKPGEKRIVKRGNKEFLEIDPASKAFFWNRFPDNSLIVIDEIQKFLSNIKEVGDSEEQSLVEYFSLHRHKRHDWIFLTQNLMSLSISVRRVSEKVVECLNSKSLTLPFPISIPLRDIQTLLLGFGIQNQVYRVREGRLDGSYRVDYDGPTEAVVMNREIFELYQTHTLVENDTVGVKTDSEVPFDLGKGSAFRAVKWFVKKHWFHLFLKTMIALIILNIFFKVFATLKDPAKLGALIFGKSMAVAQSGVNPSGDVQIKRQNVDNVSEVDFEDISSKFDENSFFDADFDFKAPIISRVVRDGVVIENGLEKEVGSLTVDGRRISAISARYGVKYENAQDMYLLLLDQPYRDARWLRFQQNERSRSEAQDF